MNAQIAEKMESSNEPLNHIIREFRDMSEDLEASGSVGLSEVEVKRNEFKQTIEPSFKQDTVEPELNTVKTLPEYTVKSLDTMANPVGHYIENVAEELADCTAKELESTKETGVKFIKTDILEADVEVYLENDVSGVYKVLDITHTTPETRIEDTTEITNNVNTDDGDKEICEAKTPVTSNDCQNISEYDLDNSPTKTITETTDFEIKEENYMYDAVMDMDSEVLMVVKGGNDSKTKTAQKKSQKSITLKKNKKLKSKSRKAQPTMVEKIRKKQVKKSQKEKIMVKGKVKSITSIKEEKEEYDEGASQTKMGSKGASQTKTVSKGTSHRKKLCRMCDRCGKTLHWSSYWRHMRKHAEENGVPQGSKHLCNVCGKTYREKADLKHHIMRFHTHERPYKCDIGNCSKAFIRGTLLRIHQNTVHRNLKPFQCNECLQTFKRKHCLYIHMQNQHVTSCQKTCPTCREYFNQRLNLVYHMKAHKDPDILVCKVCDKQYKLKSSLEKHVRTHKSGVECEICGEEFSRRSYLLQHQWKHTGTYHIDNYKF